MSTKNSNDTSWDRTSDLPICSYILVAAYFIHCSWPVPEAVITVVRAADDGCQHPKHVEPPTEI